MMKYENWPIPARPPPHGRRPRQEGPLISIVFYQRTVDISPVNNHRMKMKKIAAEKHPDIDPKFAFHNLKAKEISDLQER